MDDFISPEQTIQKLSREQKIGFVLLLAFGIIAVTLGFVQIRNTMYAPFALNSVVPPDVKDAVNDAAALQYRDTDGDGLSDFSELYVYSTSPYIKDTDGDGLDDKAEILQGKNPLCAEGAACNNFIYNDNLTGSQNSTSSINGVVIPPDPGALPEFIKQIQDPKQVREMIIASGAVSKEILDQIPDNLLMQEVYNQTKTSFQALNIPFEPLLPVISTSSEMASGTIGQPVTTTISR